MLIWPFIKQEDIPKMKKNVLFTQVMYTSAAMVTLVYLFIAFCVSEIAETDINQLLPGGLILSGCIGIIYARMYIKGLDDKE